MKQWIYRIGVSVEEINKVLSLNLNKEDVSEILKKVNFKFSVVEPKKQLISSLESVIGRPFKRGASVLKDSPHIFDCSSLVSWAAVESGFSIPRVSIDQYVYSRRIEKENLVVGDLVFANTGEIIHTEGSYFSQILGKNVQEEAIRTETLEFMPGTKISQGIDHVGVYIGGGEIIHASGQTNSVIEENLDTSKSFKNIIGYGRIINSEEERFVVEIPSGRLDLRTKEGLIKEIEVLCQKKR